MALNTISVKEFFAKFQIIAASSSNDQVNVLAETDGTLRSQLVLYHSGTTQIRQKAETDGTAMESNYGKASGTLTAFKVESTGEQDIVDHGKTSGGTITAKRVDAAGFQRTRPFEPYEATAVVEINTTATTVYTVPASTIAVVEVEFTNIDTVANTFDFHIVASGGSAGATNIMLNDFSISAGSPPLRVGPYCLGAGVTLQALAAGSTNGDIKAIAFVKEYGTGDAVALV